MRSRKRIVVAVLMAAVAAAGCAKTYAPSGWLPSASDAPQSPYGAWVHVEYRYTGNLQANTGGELIAMSADSMYVLVPQGRLLAVCNHDVIRAQAEAYDAGLGAVAAWSILGTLSTLSHGYYLIFSAPLWIVSGSASGSVLSREPIVSYPDDSLASFAALARFPQGLPPNIRRRP